MTSPARVNLLLLDELTAAYTENVRAMRSQAFALIEAHKLNVLQQVFELLSVTDQQAFISEFKDDGVTDRNIMNAIKRCEERVGQPLTVYLVSSPIHRLCKKPLLRPHE